MTRYLTPEEIENMLDFIVPRQNIPEETAQTVVESNKERFRIQLRTQKVFPEIIPQLKIELETVYRRTQIQPGESVGIICAQSIGEKNTQMSNSKDEKIILKSGSKIINTTIGSYIDSQMETDIVIDIGNDSLVKPMEPGTQILTVTQDEKLQWQDITELSRHLPHGGMVKVTTQSGRSVTTTLSHSHLKRENDRIVPILASELKTGDRIPVTKKIPIPFTGVDHINISNYVEDYDRSKMENTIQIDERFGWFIGAYLAEGNCTKYETCITNINQEFEEGVDIFSKSVGLTYSSRSYQGEYGPGKTYKIGSKILSSLMISLCGTGSLNKKIPSFVFGAPKAFIASIIQGWMDGDGNISSDPERKLIRGFSISRSLLEQFAILLSYFGIFGTIGLQKKSGSLYQYVIHGREYCQIYLNEIGTRLLYKKEALNSIMETEDSRLEMIPTDITPHITRISSSLQMKGHSMSYATYERNKWDIGRNTLKKMIDKFEEKGLGEENREDMDALYQAYNANIVWDKIVKIEEVDYKHKYVYDFSITGNETFALQSGIIVHNTLNTFHKAGQSEKGMIAGVPRFQELLNATQKPKIVCCKVFFKEGNKTIQELRSTIGNTIVGLTFKDIAISMKVIIEKEPEMWYESYKVLYNDNFTKYTSCISVKLNMKILFEYKLSMQDIADLISSEYDDISCVFSPPGIGQFDIFVDTTTISLPENRLLFVDTENAPLIYLEESVQPVIENMLVCGIPGITNIYYMQEGDEWMVDTDGSNFKKLLAHPAVDMSRVVSNNVWDIYNTLGIEAAREFLIEEYMSIMEGITICHTKLLVERMTFSGTISSISRYTMRKDESGPMSKASFEETVDNFLNAASHGDVEPTNGVSSSIMCGKRANIGTGMMDIRVDIARLPLALPIITEEVSEVKTSRPKTQPRKKKRVENKGVGETKDEFVEI